MPRGYLESDGSYNERNPSPRSTPAQRIASLVQHRDFLERGRDKWRERAERAIVALQRLAHAHGVEPGPILKEVCRADHDSRPPTS